MQGVNQLVNAKTLMSSTQNATEHVSLLKQCSQALSKDKSVTVDK